SPNSLLIRFGTEYENKVSGESFFTFNNSMKDISIFSTKDAYALVLLCFGEVSLLLLKKHDQLCRESS
ncbi:MAG: hypothetical protein LBG19_13245, partial [Prevotellaceae bacterium]|nr:hypothetical protein [Prevotellaceae bacterium]